MATTTPPRALAALVAMLIAVALLAAPATARAASTAPNYRLTQLTYSNGSAVGTCRGWGGDTDAAGNFYMACPVMRDVDGNGTGDVNAPALYEIDTSGVVRRLGWLPPEYAFNDSYPIRDVGVSPDGNTAYVSVGPNTDNLGQHPELNPTTKQVMANGATTGSILRLTRQADGNWAYDPGFKLSPINYGGNYWALRYVDVDARGHLYVTVNGYVYEFDATGAIVSAFGGARTDGPGGRWLDGLDKAEGIAVTPDGNTLFIVEQQHQLVQRWNRVGTTDWARDTTFLLGIPDEVGDYCGTNDHFQSPYDVALDGAGDIYVMDTTCQRVQRFNSAGAYLQTVWTNVGGDDMNHGLAVNWQGSVLLPIEEDLLVRLDPPAKPAAPRPAAPGGGNAVGGGANCTDKARPQLASVEADARTTTRRVTVSVTATDDCGVTQVRVLGERMGTGAWVDGTSLVVPMGGWNGRKNLVAQVRDAAGNIASRRFQVVMVLPQPKLVARTRVNLRGRGCSSVNPYARVRGYRLVDRCARISGRVLVAKRRGRSYSLLVLVPAGQARRMYVNAVGPVRVWVVTDARTRISGRIRARRPVIVDGSLVAERNRSAVYAIPVDRVHVR